MLGTNPLSVSVPVFGREPFLLEFQECVASYIDEMKSAEKADGKQAITAPQTLEMITGPGNNLLSRSAV